LFTQAQKEKFKGSGVLLMTPFNEDLSLDLAGFKKNVDYVLKSGMNASNGFLIANGSTGECYAMNMEERKQVIKAAVEAADGKIPVIAGCNDTDVFNVIELANYSKSVGVDAVMIVQPYYLPYNAAQIYNFYEFINARVDIPIMLYNNPIVGSGSDMSVELLHKIAKLSNVFALKETSENIKRFFHAEALTSELIVFAGSSCYEPFAALAKMSGFISFDSCFYPKLGIRMWEATQKGDYQEAQKVHQEEFEMYNWWWSGGINQTFGQVAYAKKALDLLGLAGGMMRPPLLPLNAEQTKGLKELMVKWGLLK
jgi:4-hydroxy-tetrahydrodipicolinate synthase